MGLIFNKQLCAANTWQQYWSAYWTAGLVSVSCLDNWAGEKGQQDWSVGCLHSRAGDTDRESKT